MKGWKKIFQATGNERKAERAVFISDKIDSKLKITEGYLSIISKVGSCLLIYLFLILWKIMFKVIVIS